MLFMLFAVLSLFYFFSLAFSVIAASKQIGFNNPLVYAGLLKIAIFGFPAILAASLSFSVENSVCGTTLCYFFNTFKTESVFYFRGYQGYIDALYTLLLEWISFVIFFYIGFKFSKLKQVNTSSEVNILPSIMILSGVCVSLVMLLIATAEHGRSLYYNSEGLGIFIWIGLVIGTISCLLFLSIGRFIKISCLLILIIFFIYLYSLGRTFATGLIMLAFFDLMFNKQLISKKVWVRGLFVVFIVAIIERLISDLFFTKTLDHMIGMQLQFLIFELGQLESLGYFQDKMKSQEFIDTKAYNLIQEYGWSFALGKLPFSGYIPEIAKISNIFGNLPDIVIFGNDKHLVGGYHFTAPGEKWVLFGNFGVICFSAILGISLSLIYKLALQNGGYFWGINAFAIYNYAYLDFRNTTNLLLLLILIFVLFYPFKHHFQFREK